MQPRKAVNNPEAPIFNIRKVNRKMIIGGKQGTELNHVHSETEEEKVQEYANYSSVNRGGFEARKEKEIMLDQSVNEAIIKSKPYSDLKKQLLDNKKRYAETKKLLELEIQKKKEEKMEALVEQEKLEIEKPRFIESLNAIKEKIHALREANERYREALNNRMSGQAEYIENLIVSMRFQAEYEHDIDPDQMTYEELLELEEKIGVVSKGLPHELIQTLPKIEVEFSNDEKCPVCYSNYEQGEIRTQIFNCKHEFHFECLESWLGKEKICPLCKQEIEFPMEDVQTKEEANEELAEENGTLDLAE